MLAASETDGDFEWESQLIDEYLDVLVEMTEACGGGVVKPDVAVTDCDDYEDNRILELALACQAVLIVSNDSDLLHMTPWRRIPILPPLDFESRVDAARRARRR